MGKIASKELGHNNWNSRGSYFDENKNKLKD
jgi:hypothetical protein